MPEPMVPRRGRPKLGYKRIVRLLLYLVTLPCVLLSAVGVLLFVLGEARYNLLLGILILTFIGMAMRGPYWYLYWPWEAWPDIPARI